MTMRTGLFGGAGPSADADPLAAFVADVAAADAEGFPSYWTSQVFTLDALTAIATAASRAPRIEIGTSVVPVQPRHPVALAQQALTTNLALGGRLALGIGLSHQVVVENMWGMSFDRPFTYMREYLDALLPLLESQTAAAEGELVTAKAQLQLPGAPAPTVFVAALGPRMLDLAGRRTAGTITWMTGPKTLESHIVPAMTRAAEDAGREPPRIVAGFPVCVTDDAIAARERAGRTFAVYGHLPSYRAMLDREGADGPADVAIVGDEDAVGARLGELDDAGVTDFAASVFGSAEERERTRKFLVERVSAGR